MQRTYSTVINLFCSSGWILFSIHILHTLGYTVYYVDIKTTQKTIIKMVKQVGNATNITVW